MLYILYGEDNFSIKESLTKIKADCGGAELGESNAILFDGGKVSLNELVSICNTMSFLAPKRLVMVEGLLTRFEPKGGTRDQSPLEGSGVRGQLKDWSALAEHVVNMPESTVLVLLDGKLTRANPLLKKLSPLANVREYVPLKGPKLQNWIRARVAGNGCEISPSALRLLTNLIGNNLWILSNEIDKLSLHAREGHIEEDNINSLVSYARESDIFATVDAIVRRQMGRASLLIHQLLDEGSAPPYLLYMMTRQFRLLIQARRLMADGLPASAIGSKIGETTDWKLEKVLSQARGYSLERLEESYRRLLHTDLSIKTGTIDGALALDLLITDLCAE
ncbi:MAG: DNA polymerase III subunit delta [Dehalococcoidia bacterium]|nr:DNA polymerase III subunit delta [Chloroflexota bacterium]MBT9161957.1 DNA polymerase III subunit delta [Chloroflexota bacterium]